MAHKDSTSYSGRSWYSMSQPGGANLLNRSRVRLGILVEEASNTFLDGYNGIQNTVSRYLHRAAPGIATPTESVDLEFQPVSDQQVTYTDQEPEGTPGTTIRSNNPPSALEADDRQRGGQPASVREHGSIETPLARSRRTWMWVAALVLGLMLLIMVPGLILGAATGQVAWGIAISGAVAPAVVFFGGLYYHHNR